MFAISEECKSFCREIGKDYWVPLNKLGAYKYWLKHVNDDAWNIGPHCYMKGGITRQYATYFTWAECRLIEKAVKQKYRSQLSEQHSKVEFLKEFV